jgi:3-mercaptopyruvate sulfurtransferase SseA
MIVTRLKYITNLRSISTVIKRSPLISIEELDQNYEKLKVIDATWFLPNSLKTGKEEYLKQHLKVNILTCE